MRLELEVIGAAEGGSERRELGREGVERGEALGEESVVWGRAVGGEALGRVLVCRRGFPAWHSAGLELGMIC